MDCEFSSLATVAHQFCVDAESVFAAWLDVQIMQTAFFCSNSGFEQILIKSEPIVGGHFMYAAYSNGVRCDHCGEYLELRCPNKLVFTWQVNLLELPVSKLYIDIEDKVEGAHLVLVHELPFNWNGFVVQAEMAWTQFLIDFERALMAKSSHLGYTG